MFEVTEWRHVRRRSNAKFYRGSTNKQNGSKLIHDLTSSERDEKTCLATGSSYQLLSQNLDSATLVSATLRSQIASCIKIPNHNTSKYQQHWKTSVIQKWFISCISINTPHIIYHHLTNICTSVPSVPSGILGCSGLAKTDSSKFRSPELPGMWKLIHVLHCTPWIHIRHNHRIKINQNNMTLEHNEFYRSICADEHSIAFIFLCNYTLLHVLIGSNTVD